jgi:hypothetical protein
LRQRVFSQAFNGNIETVGTIGTYYRVVTDRD